MQENRPQTCLLSSAVLAAGRWIAVMQSIRIGRLQHVFGRRLYNLFGQVHSTAFGRHFEIAGDCVIQQHGVPQLGSIGPVAGVARNRCAQHAGFMAARAIIDVGGFAVDRACRERPFETARGVVGTRTDPESRRKQRDGA